MFFKIMIIILVVIATIGLSYFYLNYKTLIFEIKTLKAKNKSLSEIIEKERKIMEILS